MHCNGCHRYVGNESECPNTLDWNCVFRTEQTIRGVGPLPFLISLGLGICFYWAEILASIAQTFLGFYVASVPIYLILIGIYRGREIDDKIGATSGFFIGIFLILIFWGVGSFSDMNMMASVFNNFGTESLFFRSLYSIADTALIIPASILIFPFAITTYVLVGSIIYALIHVAILGYKTALGKPKPIFKPLFDKPVSWLFRFLSFLYPVPRR